MAKHQEQPTMGENKRDPSGRSDGSEISIYPTEGCVYCVAVRSVLIYGSETWPVGVEDICGLLVFDHRYLRNIARISWDHRVSNAVVRKRVLIRMANQFMK
ncbi:unnamed protein product [Schistosoma mattheei]|uniref:Uncharacterized protein n=1 Tax=Schistosoma mattheei TaxID=31246 RepID=A0A3P8FKN9_9TREM|nr:unnamed protein product [Schistosoma mattheei]